MQEIYGKPLEKLIPLLKNHPLDYPITLGVLDGTFSGRALVDNPESPSKALVIHGYAGIMHYLGTEPEGSEINEIAEYALAYKSGRSYCNWVEFAFCPDAVLPKIMKQHPDLKSYDRISWNHDSDLFERAPLPDIQETCVIRSLNKDDFCNEFLKFETELFWDTTDDFLKNVMGTVAFDKDGGFMGVCGAVSASDDFFEINIEVERNNRRKGIGYAVAHRYIMKCHELGKKPHWDCYHYNTASQALAKKLGFAEAGRYPLVSWKY